MIVLETVFTKYGTEELAGLYIVIGAKITPASARLRRVPTNYII